MPSMLELAVGWRPQFLTTWTCLGPYNLSRTYRAPTVHISWLPLELVISESKAETRIFHMTQPQKSCTVIAMIFDWLRRSAFFSVRENYTRHRNQKIQTTGGICDSGSHTSDTLNKIFYYNQSKLLLLYVTENVNKLFSCVYVNSTVHWLMT